MNAHSINFGEHAMSEVIGGGEGLGKAKTWSNTARAMAAHLERVWFEQRTKPDDIQMGVWLSSRRFFTHALGTTSSSTGDYASVVVHALATRILLRLEASEPLDVDQALYELASFNASLDLERTLNDAEMTMARRLMLFLREIEGRGESERYAALEADPDDE